MDMQVYKDGSLRAAYGFLCLCFLVMALIMFLLGNDGYSGALLATGLLFLLLIPQLSSGPILKIDDNGIWKRNVLSSEGKFMAWGDIRRLNVGYDTFENNRWPVFKIYLINREKPVEIVLERTTIFAKDLFDKLVAFVEDQELDIEMIGLMKWQRPEYDS